jgi:hypothetical protein
MRRILILCNTHYQLIVAIQLRKTIFSNDEVDCIIAGSLVTNKEFGCALEESSLFSRLICYELKQASKDNIWWLALDSYFRNSIVGLLDKLQMLSSYDEFLFANIGGLGPRLGRFLKKSNNLIKLSMFEDGLSSYSMIYAERISPQKNINNLIRRLKDSSFYGAFSDLCHYYLFCPNLSMWQNPNIERIPLEGLSDLRKTLNQIYKFQNIKDTFLEKVIFFEESYFQDGINTNDIQLVEKIALEYGKDNLLIKTHPRNMVNRFAALGYKTNTDHNIPWELIAMNIDLDNKVLITMTSTAVATTCVLLNSKAKMIYDFSGIDTYSSKRLQYTVDVINKMKNLYPNIEIRRGDE